jgi:hypothetical protein
VVKISNCNDHEGGGENEWIHEINGQLYYLANSAAGFEATKFSTGASAAFSDSVEPTICFTTPL